MIKRIIITFILASIAFYIMAWSNNFYAWEIWFTGYLGCLTATAVFEYEEWRLEKKDEKE